ncbi:hypothetical protein KVP70_23280 [Duganella sp. HSC-15S17]|nr:hypothetical protein [Duganella violaceicalia]MBV6323863.1 hypothetical protein [Duganella violaceicalia]
MALAAAFLFTVWAGRNAPTQDLPTEARISVAPHAADRPPPAPTSAAANPTSEISLTDNQDLIADFALRKVMDGFLLYRREAGRMQALADHLHRVLPAGAAAEAIRIAANYQAYLTAHDELLAAQRFTSNDAASQDLNRIGSWQQQRQQLRIRTLGERITLEWFGNEDVYLGQALDERRQRSEGHPPAADAAPEDQAAHDQHMQQAVNQAIASYQRAASAN